MKDGFCKKYRFIDPPITDRDYKVREQAIFWVFDQMKPGVNWWDLRGIMLEELGKIDDIIEVSKGRKENKMSNRELNEIRINKLTEAAKPLIKLLSEEYHPHHTVIVTSTSVKLLEEVFFVPKIYDFTQK